MLATVFLTFLSLVLSTSVIAVPAPGVKEVEAPSGLNSISDHTLWASIREIAESTSPNKNAEVEKLIKGTFLDPEVITTTESTSEPTTQDIHCETTRYSPLYSDSLLLVSIVYNRQESTHGFVSNPGGTCTLHGNYNTARFGICSPVPVVMNWRSFGHFSYSITAGCVRNLDRWVSGGRYVWDSNINSDVRVY